MIYDTVISTGDATISGCSSKELDTNNFNSGNLIAGGVGNNYYFDVDSVTGQRNMKLSLNGQALLQEVPVTGNAQNYIFYSNKTGDFFIKGREAPDNEQSKLFFDSSTPISSSSNIVYDVVTGGNFAGTGDLGPSLKSSIDGAGIGISFSMEDFEFFLNGQKVYSGAGIGVSADTNIYFSIANGVVDSSNFGKFKYTAYKRRQRTHEVTGIEPDLFGSGFVEGRNKYYINGIQQPQSNYLELYTGVSIIQTGLSCLISGGTNSLATNSLIL